MLFRFQEGISTVITITEDQAAQVKYLIDQAIQGNHILFDPATLRRVLSKPAPSLEEAYGVEHHIEKLMTLPGLREKRTYLERLDHQTFDLVVKTYFNIVENSLFEANGTTH